jgi:hypothetical protein
MAVELERKQLEERERVGGCQGAMAWGKTHISGARARARRRDLLQPGVDARAVGLQRRARGLVLIIERLRANVCRSNRRIRRSMAGCARRKLGQSSLHRAAQHRHLPEPVLGMSVAKAKKTSSSGLPKMWGTFE